MIIHRLCLGTWFPRTSIHLKEVFHFLQSKEGIRGLDPKKLKKLHDNLGVTGFKLHEELTADFFRAFFPGGQFLMTEEGVLLIRTENAIESLGHEFAKARDFCASKSLDIASTTSISLNAGASLDNVAVISIRTNCAFVPSNLSSTISPSRLSGPPETLLIVFHVLPSSEISIVYPVGLKVWVQLVHTTLPISFKDPRSRVSCSCRFSCQ